MAQPSLTSRWPWISMVSASMTEARPAISRLNERSKGQLTAKIQMAKTRLGRLHRAVEFREVDHSPPDGHCEDRGNEEEEDDGDARRERDIIDGVDDPQPKGLEHGQEGILRHVCLFWGHRASALAPHTLR